MSFRMNPTLDVRRWMSWVLVAGRWRAMFLQRAGHDRVLLGRVKQGLGGRPNGLRPVKVAPARRAAKTQARQRYARPQTLPVPDRCLNQPDGPATTVLVIPAIRVDLGGEPHRHLALTLPKIPSSLRERPARDHRTRPPA